MPDLLKTCRKVSCELFFESIRKRISISGLEPSLLALALDLAPLVLARERGPWIDGALDDPRTWARTRRWPDVRGVRHECAHLDGRGRDESRGVPRGISGDRVDVLARPPRPPVAVLLGEHIHIRTHRPEVGRASCRERV